MLDDRGTFGRPIKPLPPTVPDDLSATFRPALAELLKAFDCARDAGRTIWDFALNLDRLHIHKLTETDCRWLIAMGYAEQAREVTRHEDTTRQFRATGNLRFSKRSCVVLTEHG